MNRRRSLPGADELFRQTTPPPRPEGWFDTPPQPSHRVQSAPNRTGSPRQKHSSKITVYVSDEELLALEHARLALRAAHGIVLDRGRVVREAVAIVLADFEERGEDSVLVRRLRQGEGQ